MSSDAPRSAHAEGAPAPLVFSRKRSRGSGAGGLEGCLEAGVAAEPARPAPKAAPSGAGPKAPRQLTQTYIDVGQRDFFAAKCAVCGLLYSKGNEADDKLHAAFHAKAVNGPSLRGWQAKVVLDDGARGQVLMAAPSASANSRRLEDLCAFLESQMGLVPGWLLSVPTTAFLYVVSQHIAGCVVVESIKAACATVDKGKREARPCSAGTAAIGGAACTASEAAAAAVAAPSAIGQEGPGAAVEGRDPDFQGSVLVDQAQSVRAACGVRLIWVSVKARRMGLATKLLDCVRCQYLQGYVMPRHQLAFTQPTEQGAAFIRSYVGGTQYLIYG